MLCCAARGIMSRQVPRFVAVAAALAVAACSSTSGTSTDAGVTMTDEASSQKLPIGSACTMDTDCGGTGFMCMTDHPGGYCIEMCDVKNHDADCPSGSVCQFDGMMAECHKLCSASSDCRVGYFCAPASTAPNNTVSHAFCDVVGDAGMSTVDGGAG